MTERVTAAVRRSQRINLRVGSEADELLRAAARLERKSLSSFMLESALERAHQVLEAERRLELRAEEFDRIVAELDRPGRVVTPLLKLVARAARHQEGTSE
jgi:uncharacterized protein (DUF1778 family)